MLILDALKEVYKIYEQASTAPDTTSDDFAIRMAYANNSISKWENEIGMDWRELYVPSYTGTLDATGSANMPANFKAPLSFLQIGNTKYSYVPPERFDEMQFENRSYFFTVMGSVGSFVIKTQPAKANAAFSIDYKKYATTFVTGAETTPIDMSDPYFLINDVLAQIYEQDTNFNMVSIKMQTAGAKLDSMKLVNEKTPFNNPNSLPDDDFQGFGN